MIKTAQDEKKRKQVIWAKLKWRAITAVLPLWQSV